MRFDGGGVVRRGDDEIIVNSFQTCNYESCSSFDVDVIKMTFFVMQIFSFVFW